MPWRCPSCRTPIEHNDREQRPALDTLYRCHVCRLDLVLDAIESRLVEVSGTTALDIARTESTHDRARNRR